jgi:hypothetical protein
MWFKKNSVKLRVLRASVVKIEKNYAPMWLKNSVQLCVLRVSVVKKDRRLPQCTLNSINQF